MTMPTLRDEPHAPPARLDGGPLPRLAYMPGEETLDPVPLAAAATALARFADPSDDEGRARSNDAARASHQGEARGPTLRLIAPATGTATPGASRRDRLATGRLVLEITRRQRDHADVVVQDDEGRVGRIQLRHPPAALAAALASPGDPRAIDAARRAIVHGTLDALEAIRLRRCADPRRTDAHARLLAAVRWSADPNPEGRGTPTATLPFLGDGSRAWTYVPGGGVPMRIDADHQALLDRIDASCGPHFAFDPVAPSLRDLLFEIGLAPHQVLLPRPEVVDALRILAEVESMPLPTRRPEDPDAG